MGLPLPAGSVLLRLSAGPPEAVAAVFDALERVFPSHTGRGRSLAGNAWEDPPVLTTEHRWTVADGDAPGDAPAVTWSQAFDTLGSRLPASPLDLDAAVTVSVLGTPEDVERLLHVLAELVTAEERGREEAGPLVEVRLRLRLAGAGAA
ncbi:hypothetical protein ACFYNO_25975 [Kitasatospora sp. NPDC006697]|uniref:hypothetical protein n=1 Tax=Kitasatospora sp. NPDC006697 TaxID=3364020 RepID=UPI0036A875A8